MIHFHPPIFLPYNYLAGSGNSAATTISVSAANGGVGCIIKAYEDCTIHKVQFALGTVVQDQTVRVSFQTGLTTGGNPPDVQSYYRDFAFLGTDDTQWKTTGIISSDGTDGGSLLSLNAGDYFAVVIDNPNFVAGDIFRLVSFGAPSITTVSSANDYLCIKTGGTWARSNVLHSLIVEKSDGTIIDHPFMFPMTNLAAGTAQTNASNPIRRGIKFNSPFNMEIMGFRAMMTVVAAGTSVCKLCDSNGIDVIATSNPSDEDTDWQNLATVGYRSYIFANPQYILANKDYYFYFEATNANGLTLRQGTLGADALSSVLHPFNTFHAATQHSTNAPTDIPGTFNFGQLIVHSIYPNETSQKFNLGFN